MAKNASKHTARAKPSAKAPAAKAQSIRPKATRPTDPGSNASAASSQHGSSGTAGSALSHPGSPRPRGKRASLNDLPEAAEPKTPSLRPRSNYGGARHGSLTVLSTHSSAGVTTRAAPARAAETASARRGRVSQPARALRTRGGHRLYGPARAHDSRDRRAPRERHAAVRERAPQRTERRLARAAR